MLKMGWRQVSGEEKEVRSTLVGRKKRGRRGKEKEKMLKMCWRQVSKGQKKEIEGYKYSVYCLIII